jgi:hypothetical protein
MSPELLAISELLEQIHAELAVRPSHALRDWPRRTEAYARVIEGWLRFGCPPTEAQRMALLESVGALHAEVFGGSGVQRVGVPAAAPPRRESA